MIPIAKPQVGPEEIAAVQEVLSSGALIQGKRVAEFEARFADYHGVKHGIATNNGTSALTAALMAHQIGPGDEVIVPAFSFFATASSVLSVGATPVFADIDPESFCVSVDSIREKVTSRTKAVIPVHLYGRPAAMEEIAGLCADKGLALVEDAAQAHGAAIGEKHVGSWGTACFSFYPTKNMTTTEGGMVTTNDDRIAERLRMIRNQGMNTRYYHEVVGYNLRMTDLCAAIGIIQLGKLPGWTEQRIENARYYGEKLTTVETPTFPSGHTHVFHQYTVRLPGGRSRKGLDRDAVVQALNDAGIGVRVYYARPIHQQPALLELGGFDDVKLPETERAASEVFSLPVHPALTEEERATVAQKVNEIC
jgi:dTDP-4-amino-4,6-dideoxygalactose transaminase